MVNLLLLLIGVNEARGMVKENYQNNGWYVLCGGLVRIVLAWLVLRGDYNRYTKTVSTIRMPNPANLPTELFTDILDLSLYDSDARHLCHLSLLSRRWHNTLVPRIYTKWTYNGARQPFMTLLKFLVAIRHSPDLAALVRTLDVGNWGFFPRPDSGKDVQLELPDTELELIRIAIREAGISGLEDDIVRSLSENDRRPLMALLLMSLPNPETLYAHVPRSDPVLGAVLKRMLDLKDSGSSSHCLSRLRELYLL